MDTLTLSPYARGQEQARVLYQQLGPRYLQRLVERAAIAGLSEVGTVTRHPEFWRGLRNETAALCAIASRRSFR